MNSTFVSSVTCIRHHRVSHYRVVATFQEVFDPLTAAPLLFKLLEPVMIEKLGSETTISLDEPKKAEPPAKPPERVIEGVSLWFTTYFMVKVRVRSKPTGNADSVYNVYVETSSGREAAMEIGKASVAAENRIESNQYWEAVTTPSRKGADFHPAFENEHGRGFIVEAVNEA